MKKTGRIRNPFATSNYLLKKKIERSLPYLKGRILDFGAGFGQYTRYLRDKDLTVDCYEPTEEMRNPDLEYITEFEESYDTVLLVNVLHHAEDHDKLLSRIMGLSNRVIVSELNADSWLVRNYHRVFVRDEIGLHFSRNAFQGLLSDFGVIDSWTQNLGPFRKVHMFAVLERSEE